MTRGDARRQHAPGGVVQIHHLDAARAAADALSLSFDAEVRLHGPVVVEVVAGEVGEDAGREAEAVEPALVEAVRRRLHRHVGHASRQQLGQRGLQVDRPRRGERAGGRVDRLAAPVERAQRADAAGARRRVEADGGCRPVVVVLPLVPVTPIRVSRRPGWPYQAAPSTSAARRPSRTTISGTPACCATLDHHRRGPAPDRVGHEAVAVGLRAANGDVRRCPARRCGCPCRSPAAPGRRRAPRPAGPRAGARRADRARPCVIGSSLRPSVIRAQHRPPRLPGAAHSRPPRRHRAHHSAEPAQAHPEPPPVERERGLADRTGPRRPAPAGARCSSLPGGTAGRRHDRRRRPPAPSSGARAAGARVARGEARRGRSPPGARPAPAAASSG